MSNNLSLTDGTTTVNLNSGNILTLDYAMSSAGSFDALPPSLNETGTLLVSGATTAAVQTNLNSIERLLSAARRRQETQTGPKVYLQAQWGGESTTWRSEVVGGRLETDPGELFRKKVEAALDIERAPWWEESTLTTLVSAQALTNNGTNNSILIDGGDIDGVIPSPAWIQLTNTSGSAIYWDRFWLSCNAYNDPENFAGKLAIGDAAASSQSWTGAQTAHAYASWTLSSALLTDCAGDYFRVLAAFNLGGTPVPSDIYFTTRIKYSVTEIVTADPVWTGPGVTKGFFDLGALPLPPGGYYTSNDALTLALTVRASATGEASLNFLQLLPAGPGRLRLWEQIGYAAANGASIVDDPYEEIIYYLTGSNRVPLVVNRGDPLLLWPGRDNRIAVLFDESDAAVKFSATRTTTITVKHRPRRLAL